MVGVWFPFLMYAFICAHDHFPCLITVVLNSLYQMECRIFFVSYSCNVRSSPLLTSVDDSKFDVDANQQQEVLNMYANTIVSRCS